MINFSQINQIKLDKYHKTVNIGKIVQMDLRNKVLDYLEYLQIKVHFKMTWKRL